MTSDRRHRRLAAADRRRRHRTKVTRHIRLLSQADELVTANLASQTNDGTLRKVAKELAPKGSSEQQVAQRMEEFLHIALEQNEAGK